MDNSIESDRQVWCNRGRTENISLDLKKNKVVKNTKDNGPSFFVVGCMLTDKDLEIENMRDVRKVAEKYRAHKFKVPVSAQDGIVEFRKAHARSAPSLCSLGVQSFYPARS